jgi:hypothetical protein
MSENKALHELAKNLAILEEEKNGTYKLQRKLSNFLLWTPQRRYPNLLPDSELGFGERQSAFRFCKGFLVQ